MIADHSICENRFAGVCTQNSQKDFDFRSLALAFHPQSTVVQHLPLCRASVGRRHCSCIVDGALRTNFVENDAKHLGCLALAQAQNSAEACWHLADFDDSTAILL